MTIIYHVYSILRDDLNPNTEVDLKVLLKIFIQKLHLNETAVCVILQLQIAKKTIKNLWILT